MKNITFKFYLLFIFNAITFFSSFASDVQDEISYVEERASVSIAIKDVNLSFVLSRRDGRRLAEVYVCGYSESEDRRLVVRKLLPIDLRRSGKGVYEEKVFNRADDLNTMMQKCVVSLAASLDGEAGGDFRDGAISINDMIRSRAIDPEGDGGASAPIWELWKELSSRFD